MNDEIDALTKRIAAGLANNEIQTEKQLAVFFLKEYEASYKAAFNAGIAAAAEIARQYEPDERLEYVDYASDKIKELEKTS